MSTPRIVVTGIGATSPIGGTAPKAGPPCSPVPPAPVPSSTSGSSSTTCPSPSRPRRSCAPRPCSSDPSPSGSTPRRSSPWVAAKEAWEDAGSPDIDPDRLGVDFATGIGGVWTLLDAWDTLREKGPRRVMPMTVPMLMPNAAAGNLSLHFNARAFARTVASACASSTESIVNAVQHIRDGLADVVIAGGTESAIHRSRSPRSRRCRRCRSATTRRDRFASGQHRPRRLRHGRGRRRADPRDRGARKARGAKIYASIVGGGVTADSYHITANDPEGHGAARAVHMALEMAGASVDDVTHINAHATSTPVGDPNEYKALRAVFGDRVDEIPVSATKAPPATFWAAPEPSRRSSRFSPCRTASRPHDQPDRAGPRGSVRALGIARRARRGRPARDQQLLRLRRAQRRRRHRLGLSAFPVTTRAPWHPPDCDRGCQGALVSSSEGYAFPCRVCSPTSGSGASPTRRAHPTLCSHTICWSSPAWRKGSSSSSQAEPRATSSSRCSSKGSPAATSIA